MGQQSSPDDKGACPGDEDSSPAAFDTRRKIRECRLFAWWSERSHRLSNLGNLYGQA